MKALIVSSVFPPREDRETCGVYRRLGLFVRALGAVFEEIRILHYAFEKRAVDEMPEGGWSRWLSGHWQVPVGVRVCRRRRSPRDELESLRQRNLVGFEGPMFYTYCGPEQVAAFEQEMECKPDLLFVHRLGAMCAVLRFGAKGLDFENEEEIVLREKDAGIAAACVRLLRDSNECQRLGAAAHRTARALYDAAAIQQRIISELRSMLAGRKHAR